tara:strand:+ start:89 stop:481 length:393 start_codon:yes stop_codon:yes gene_type:complete
MTTLHLPNNLTVQVSTLEKNDNIVFSFQWNKPAHCLPFPEDIQDSMEEAVVHKNPLSLYLAKIIHRSKPNREIILSKLYSCSNSTQLHSMCGPTPSENYCTYVHDGCILVSNKKRDIHLAIIETIWNLWI